MNNEGWIVSAAKAVGASECAGVEIFGGFDKFGPKTNVHQTFANLEGHTSLLLKLQFWAIDSWDGEEARVLVDGKIIWSQKFYGVLNYT